MPPKPKKITRVKPNFMKSKSGFNRDFQKAFLERKSKTKKEKYIKNEGIENKE